MLTSCCQSTWHGFNIDTVNNNVVDLFNTPTLLDERAAILSGVQDASCAYCWKEENNGAPSKRTRESIPENLYTIETRKLPKRINISTTANLCNLTCVYCFHGVSSAWANDIEANGSYINNDGGRYTLTTKDIVRNKISITNYKQSKTHNVLLDIINHPQFKEVETIGFAGGEPLLDVALPDLIQRIVDKNKHIKIVIGTGLGVSDTIITNFITKTKGISNITLDLSIESVGKLAEFVRYGISWDKWCEHVKLLQNSHINIKATCVINIITLFGLYDFFNFCSEQGISKEVIGYNLLSTPYFLDISNFNENITKDEISKLVELDTVPDTLKESLVAIQKQQVYNSDAQRDLITFIPEFAKRRNLDIAVLPQQIKGILNGS